MNNFRNASFYQYHQLTKHTVESLLGNRYSLDWDNQPDPFRTYSGSTNILLPRSIDIQASPLSYFELIQAMYCQDSKYSANMVNAKPNEKFLSSLLFYSLAISAWKQIVGTNHRWALRVNASSGNLHPTELHIMINQIEGLAQGLYHYNVKNHSLEQRSCGQHTRLVWELLGGTDVNCPPVLLCLTSIHWREVWKYRQRGFRYCQHDIGHALSSVITSASCLGWNSQIFSLFPDETIAKFLRISDSNEKPYIFVALRPKDNSLMTEIAEKRNMFLSEEDFLTKTSKLEQTDHYGQWNTLSPAQIEYKIIDQTYKDSCYNWTEWQSRLRLLKHLQKEKQFLPFNINQVKNEILIPFQPLSINPITESIHCTIRRRRSALAMQYGRTMHKNDLTAILFASTRGFQADFQRPISCNPLEKTEPENLSLIHLFLYIHNVEKLPQGVYYYNRFKQSLLLLTEGNQREIARGISCFQDIASDSCIALSMVADMKTAYSWYGNRGYRLIHYEAGFIGQQIYLSSTALGYDSTGIGCFLDDAINHHLKLPEGFEVIYNFTIGQSIPDPRLTSLPSYDFPDPTVS